MQRQQDHGPTEAPVARRGPRRSWGELLVAFLLSLIGIGWLGVMLNQVRDALKIPSILPFALLWLVPGAILLLSGGALLLRARQVARWLLAGVAALGLAGGGWLLYAGLTVQENIGDPNQLTLFGGVILAVSVGLLALARWIGRQQDLEVS